MATIRIRQSASHRLDAIYRYRRDRWGEAQADTYITGLFAAFDRIATHDVAKRDHVIARPVRPPLAPAPASRETDDKGRAA